MFIFMAAAWVLLVSFDVSTWYKPLEWGMVAMVCPFGFFMVHICLWNMTLWSALSSLLMDSNVKAISGV